MYTSPTGRFTLRLEQQSQQTIGEITKFIGLARVNDMIELLNSIDLEANPRSSKVGTVTSAIIESLQNSHDLYPFKSKGLLVGASSYKALDRDRISIEINDPNLEGILDGGHNALAIGMFLLEAAGVSAKDLRPVKNWIDFKELWASNSDLMQKVKSEFTGNRDGDRTFPIPDLRIPIEVVVPRDPEDPGSLDEFKNSILDICAARNNNVELKLETRANQSGHFDHLKSVLPEAISKNVEWKTNDGGTIKAVDIVALTWIPLSVLDKLPNGVDGKPIEPPVPQNIYRGKGDCMTRFERLLDSQEVSIEENGKSKLVDTKVMSALEVASRLPELFDYIYSQLPSLYNKDGGKFGRITAVQKMNKANSRAEKRTKFTHQKVSTNLPEGFVIPIVYGLRALIGKDEVGNVYWQTDPLAFLKKHAAEIVPQICTLIPTMGYDPQKFGKENSAYVIAETVYRMVLLQEAGTMGTAR